MDKLETLILLNRISKVSEYKLYKSQIFVDERNRNFEMRFGDEFYIDEEVSWSNLDFKEQINENFERYISENTPDEKELKEFEKRQNEYFEECKMVEKEMKLKEELEDAFEMIIISYISVVENLLNLKILIPPKYFNNIRYIDEHGIIILCHGKTI